MERRMEEFNLLESLKDLVDQLGRGKISEENVYITLEALVNFNNDEDDPKFNCDHCGFDGLTYEDVNGEILDHPICLDCDEINFNK
tara:strand:+ start:476 stop:733 length:258 start_codon:yes stop_codon:yes gene_type:complete